MKDLTILVVDDEPDLRELVAFEFELVGAKVLNAGNGSEAFALVKEGSIDVVVSDIRMPGGDGVELLQKVRGLHPTKPALIFMTGFADISLEDAYDKGAAAIFGKPFSRKELIDAVTRSVQPLKDRWSNKPSQASFVHCLELNYDDIMDAKKNHRFNMGKGGFFIAYDGPLPNVSEPAQFKIALKVDGIQNIEGDGVVRWVRRQHENNKPKGVGLELRSLTGVDREKVLKLVETQKTSAFIPKS